MKSIKKLLPTGHPHWAGTGFHVYPVFRNLVFTNDISPFLLFDYAAPKTFPPTVEKLGAAQHPHRGFETVSIAYQGEVAHADSAGHSGVIGPGDVQWMTAASGVIHEEFHSDKFAREGGIFEMVQLWVNLPSKYKMSMPRYQHALKNEIPVVPLGNDTGEVRVIAGGFNDTKGTVSTYSPINVWELRLAAWQFAQFELPKDHTAIVFVRNGSVVVGECSGADSSNAVQANQAALLTTDHTTLNLQNTTAEDANILILGGEPLNEPIAAKGLFVMNTAEEVAQAERDYAEGRLGKHF